MTTFKKVKPLFNFIKKEYRQTLQKIRIDEKGMSCTDLETYLRINDTFDLQKGFQDIQTFGLVDSVEDFENFPIFDFTIDTMRNDKLKISVDTLSYILKFASKDETRLHLNGVALYRDLLVACDGHTMSYIEHGLENNDNYIMPRTSIALLIRACKAYKLKEIELQFGDDFTIVESEFFSFKMRNIYREYPNIKTVIPTRFTHTLEVTNWVNMKELKSLFCPHFKCKLKEVEGSLVLIPKQYPDNQYIIGKCSLPNFEMFFNASYIERASNGLKEFEIKINNDLTPTMINGSIVMPQRDV